MRHLKGLFLQLFFLSVLITGTVEIKAQSFTVDTIEYRGDPAKFINLVFMGDGFRRSEMVTYINNVRSLTDYFFTISPFAEYKNYFNVFAIRVSSLQSGANH